MMTVTIEMDVPLGQAIGMKEAVAMDLEEKYHCRVRVVSVEEAKPEQIRMDGRWRA